MLHTQLLIPIPWVDGFTDEVGECFSLNKEPDEESVLLRHLFQEFCYLEMVGYLLAVFQLWSWLSAVDIAFIVFEECF